MQLTLVAFRIVNLEKLCGTVSIDHLTAGLTTLHIALDSLMVCLSKLMHEKTVSNCGY